MNRYYAGIGSRATPAYMCTRLYHIAKYLTLKGYTLRSGGADGADVAFEQGCDSLLGNKEIFLPWKQFNNNTSELHNPTAAALELAEKIHPAWHNCTQGARKLHARNTHQILGIDLKTPVSFVLCWTHDRGGTKQATRLADKLNIPIINLYTDYDWLSKLKEFTSATI